MTQDSFNLERFLKAQRPVYGHVTTELKRGKKSSHWMWFVFPQMKGLGQSAFSNKYGIASLEEARAYLRHSVLGPRLIECTSLVNAAQGRSIEEIFDWDHVKFRSSMTLFAEADPSQSAFRTALEKYFGGHPDASTLEILRKSPD